jgi:hypothetical protein
MTKKLLSIEKIYFHNPLGAFDYTYVGVTRRLAGMAGPNGLAAAFSYLPNGQDRRLQERGQSRVLTQFKKSE